VNAPKRSSDNIRAIAVEILGKVETGAHADTLLARWGQRSTPDGRLLREIVLGTLTWQCRLDYHLDAYLKRPIAKQKRPIRSLLRSGAYQILHLDRVPGYAVVSECVDLSRRYGKGVSGLVNAVLRGLSENRKSVTPPNVDRKPLDHLAVTCSHPRWLVQRWLDRYGFDQTQSLCEAGNTRPPITIRTNQSRTSPEELEAALQVAGVEAVPITDLEGFLTIGAPSGLFETDAFISGWFSVQGPGAGRASRLLVTDPGDSILDVCAAPGGKSTSAAERGDVSVFASDASPNRLHKLAENRTRLGLHVPAVAADARSLPFSSSFQHVLVDAPCTGLGTLSRHPEIRWHRQPDDITRMSSLQTEILSSASNAVSSGGTLVYTTCTTEPEENEQVVENFLNSHPDFHIDTHSAAPATLSILPDTTGTDGAFGVRIRRAE
jgi:16S rRNA (cytosine967-C5)-methyltransferase